MGIRFVRDCGTLPTQVVDGNLVVFGCDKKIAASIPLPFKKKLNGRLTSEFIRYDNVFVLTEVNDSDILVMRYDNSWTIYTKDMIPIYFGTYDKETVFDPYVTIDRFGSYKDIPMWKKKPRLFAAYLIRYKQTDLMHYTAVGYPCVRELSGIEDESIRTVFIKGLNIGTEGYPCLEPALDSLVYEGWLEIPSKDTLCTDLNIQNKILRPDVMDESTYVCITRRRPYGELEYALQKRFNPPDYIWKQLDVTFMTQPDNAKAGLPQDKIMYNIAVMMNLYPDLLVGSEINGITLQFVDNFGEVSINPAQDLWYEQCDPTLHNAAVIQRGDANYKCCGYVAAKVAEISTPTVLPRLIRDGNTLYLKGASFDIGGMNVADKPDPTMAGYQECVAQGMNAVLYLADGSYKII